MDQLKRKRAIWWVPATGQCWWSPGVGVCACRAWMSKGWFGVAHLDLHAAVLRASARGLVGRDEVRCAVA